MPAAGVPAAFAIRDADPGRVKLYVDGFEVPALLSGGRALWLGSLSHANTFDDGMPLQLAGTAAIEVVTDPPGHAYGLELTPIDATAYGIAAPYTVGARLSYFTPVMRRELSLDTSTQSFLLQERYDWRASSRWKISLTGLGLAGGDSAFARATVTARYRATATDADLALSLSDHSYDARAEAGHTIRDAGGLSTLGVFGGASGSLRDDSSFDGGAWAYALATVAKSAVFQGGVRTDVFDHQVAFSPRAALGARWGPTTVSLTAAASRQAQIDRDATPERATELVARVTRAVRGLYATLDAYYIDRSRIVVDGKATGVGGAYGIEERVQLVRGAWTAYVAAALAKATRADRQTAPDHAADHDVPLRVDALASWVHGDWRLGGRVQVRSGLPYTPVTGAIYDADTDTYNPLDGKVNGARAPWRRQLDLRADYRILPKLRAYLDVALDGGVLGYTYSYDYAQRLAVRAPLVLPWLGIVGNL